MSRLEQALFRLQSDFETLGVKWALIGGLAVSALAEPRTTRDIDVTLAVEDDKEAERVVFSLVGFGYRQRPDGVFEQETLNRLSTVRLEAPGNVESPGAAVDLMFASSGIEPEIVAAAEPVEVFPGLAVPVARIGHLIALKVLAGRPQDETDLGWLLKVAMLEDLDLARRSVDLISKRRGDRGKDLAAAFGRLLAEYGDDGSER